LGVRIVAPFRLSGRAGKRVTFVALFPDFSNPRGIAVCTLDDWETHSLIAAACDYGCSAMNVASYAPYERSRFIESFEEWGWQGSAARRPRWLQKPKAARRKAARRGRAR
jgi:hypothetical protein